MVISVTVSVFKDNDTEPKVAESYVVDCPDSLADSLWINLISGEAIELLAKEAVGEYRRSTREALLAARAEG